MHHPAWLRWTADLSYYAGGHLVPFDAAAAVRRRISWGFPVFTDRLLVVSLTYSSAMAQPYGPIRSELDGIDSIYY